MLFYSIDFLFFFFPIVIIGYYLIARMSYRLTTLWLTGASLFFYAHWNPDNLILLTLSIVFNYYCSQVIRKNKSKLSLFLGVFINLLTIGYYKYAIFIISNLSIITNTVYKIDDVALPLGISFFTFQQIAWLVDSYKGSARQENVGIINYTLFVSFFPQLIAGPIVHHAEMMPQFNKLSSRKLDWGNLANGLTFFVIGLTKKVVIADSVAPYANYVFDLANKSGKLSILDAWIGALAYTFQLYFDFSGYADMAIGLALTMNIRLPINFDSPYKAVSIADFWRRWHITLGRFLRDYVYIPLGGNRKGEAGTYLNLFITMLIGGLWHGAGWTFVFWGGLHGLYLGINKFWQKNNFFQLPTSLSIFFTFISVIIAWVFFRAPSFASAVNVLYEMFNIEVLLGNADSFRINSNLSKAPALIFLFSIVVFLLPNTNELIGENIGGITIYKNPKRFCIKKIKYINSFQWVVLLSCFIFTSLYLIFDQNKVQEFIYFQF